MKKEEEITLGSIRISPNAIAALASQAALSSKINGRNIAELSAMEVDELIERGRAAADRGRSPGTP